MHDDMDLALATCRMLMIETPADQIALPPPPPAADYEAAAMWHPADRPEEMERIPLSGEGDRTAALAASIWLGGQVVELSRPDQKKDDEEEDAEPKPKKHV